MMPPSRRVYILALAGLNPHAGEGGHLGSEDRDIIAPLIGEMKTAGVFYNEIPASSGRQAWSTLHCAKE